MSLSLPVSDTFLPRMQDAPPVLPESWGHPDYKMYYGLLIYPHIFGNLSERPPPRLPELSPEPS